MPSTHKKVIVRKMDRDSVSGYVSPTQFVTEGKLDAGGTFMADTVLAKHDENYMPKEVADALKRQGHWKDEYAKGGAVSTGSPGPSR